MNKIPKFIDENNLPKGYYDEVTPLMKREASTINIKKLFQYLEENECDIMDITKEEAKFFMNDL